MLTESRQMNADNFESFYEALALEDWDEVINSDDVNNAYNEFMKCFMQIYDVSFPVRTIHRKLNVYINPG